MNMRSSPSDNTLKNKLSQQLEISKAQSGWINRDYRQQFSSPPTYSQLTLAWTLTAELQL